MELTKYQSSEVVEINRAEILNAPYNPRKISDKALQQIKNNLRKHGLMGGIVVNRTTMHLVSGHQRLKALDSLEKSENYLLRVEMVELTEQEEKEQNIFMNNKNAQGEYDLHMIKDMIPEIDYKAAGLDDIDLSMMGISLNVETQAAIDQVNEDFEELVKPVEERKAAVKEAKKLVKEKAQSKVEEQEAFFMLSFDNLANKRAFLARFDFDEDERYVKGEEFSEMIERVD